MSIPGGGGMLLPNTVPFVRGPPMPAAIELLGLPIGGAGSGMRIGLQLPPRGTTLDPVGGGGCGIALGTGKPFGVGIFPGGAVIMAPGR